MKKILIFIGTLVFAQNLYFSAFKDIQKAKKILNTNPEKAKTLFIEASSYLKQIVNSSIDANKPSTQAMSLLGELYLNGWSVEQNYKKATLLLCQAKNLGNFKAATLIKKNNLTCPQKINLKELKQ
jgi:TPR repeat protein